MSLACLFCRTAVADGVRTSGRSFGCLASGASFLYLDNIPPSRELGACPRSQTTAEESERVPPVGCSKDKRQNTGANEGTHASVYVCAEYLTAHGRRLRLPCSRPKSPRGEPSLVDHRCAVVEQPPQQNRLAFHVRNCVVRRQIRKSLPLFLFFFLAKLRLQMRSQQIHSQRWTFFGPARPYLPVAPQHGAAVSC